MGDASYKNDEKSVGGIFVMLGNKFTKYVLPLYWKSKTIPQVCHSAKDAETRNVLKLVDDSKHLALQIEQLLYDSVENRIPVRLYTDSKPTLESIASTKQVERKLLRNSIADLKSKLEDGSIHSYSWLESQDMLADILTKEGLNSQDILDVLHENTFKNAGREDNFVSFENGEIKLSNNKVKAKKDEEFGSDVFTKEKTRGEHVIL